jgi:hypothetical protein
MNINKLLSFFFCLVLACAALLPMARADEYDQKTKMTFNEPVEIPGQVLPAGTYWFVLFPNTPDRNIVQVFSKDQSKLYATVFAISSDRQQPTNRTELQFAERPHNKPEALLKWYYPGSLIGHQFLYSRKHEREFAREAKLNVMAPTTS